MINKKKLLNYFKENGWTKKPKRNIITWQEVGMINGMSGEAARAIYKRHRSEFKNQFKNLSVKGPKILIFDLETATGLAWVWSQWTKFVNHQMIEEDWYVISWAAKWLFEDEIMSDILTPEEAVENNDTRIMESLWKLLDEADIIIAHNAEKFDVKKMNARFLLLDMKPPSSYQVIDTLVHARKRFNLFSYKLNALAEYLGLGSKIDTKFELWKQSMNGDIGALTDMDKYCIQDVYLLEEVYLKMRPWIKPHPNVGLYVDSDVEVCPSCGSTHLEESGSYYTTMNEYKELRCSDCGSISRSRKAITSKKTKKRLLSSIPK